MSKEVKDKHGKDEIAEEMLQDATEQTQNGVKKEEEDETPEDKGKKEKSVKKDDKEKQIEELGQKLVEMNDKYLRLSAEFDNYRKRTLKERMELTKTAGEQLLVNILPVMDNFERGLKSMENAKDVPALREGVELIYHNFKDFLAQNGVKEMECLHTDFDADLQEAVTKIPAPTEELKGKVIDCIQKGYVMNDKVIRFPKVVVGE